ncbi:ABC transporter substrate-binding protein [Arthrobacter sp. zg-Y916]|uniref:ABC transporter substrate-binding protein n=1 Tax=Arthrobacter sp. zg-Y916 TaxID=2894190 RepID=UPI001E4DE483|nr:ABC transporter substrate-binding protein [Arthrobacter sp. zg-Y916]MCC9192108.1 ABC transporter substrate-binding protein [Arthrobacter sp. zg-Y916]
MKRHLPVLALFAAASLALSACSSAGGDTDVSEATNLDAETQALVDEAKAAGTVTLYGMVEESALRQLAADFKAAYGITVEPLRLVSSDLTQRFSSEADSGSSPADLIMLTDSPFYDEALEKEWLLPFSEAEIPGSLIEEFPAELYTHDGNTPIISMVPTEMAYNTDLVASAPTSWEEYAKPEHKGKIQIAEVDSSPANIAFWSLMRSEYGDGFLEDIAANTPVLSGGAVPGTQAVAAGESAIAHPGVLAVVKSLQGSGAPVEISSPSPTTGPEVGLGLVNNSPNPAGAKLLAAFLMSKDGNQRFNEVVSQISPYDSEGMAGFTRVRDIEMSDAPELKTLLGMN